MLCYYVSDIHLELCEDCMIILAGDPFANHYKAIVYVPGNHEYYSSTFDLVTVTSNSV
jgi:predicted phosphohydrolase